MHNLSHLLHRKQPLVQQNCAKFYKNFSVSGKSTKFGTMIVSEIVNNIGCGLHQDLSQLVLQIQHL